MYKFQFKHQLFREFSIMKGDGETTEHDGGNASDSSTAKTSSGKGQLQPVGAFSYPLSHPPLK